MPWAPAQWDSLQNAVGGHRIKWRMVTHFVAFFQVVDVTHKGCCCCPLSVTGELKPKLVSRSVARQHSEDGVLQNHIIPLQVHPLKKKRCTTVPAPQHSKQLMLKVGWLPSVEVMSTDRWKEVDCEPRRLHSIYLLFIQNPGIAFSNVRKWDGLGIARKAK